MNKMEELQALVAIATDEDRGGRERLKAFEQADEGRKELKVGWSKLGLDVDQVTALKEELPSLAEMDEADEALGEADGDETEQDDTEETDDASTADGEASGDDPADDFEEATDEELAAQSGRAKTQEELDAEAAEIEANHPMATDAKGKAAAKVAKAKAEGTGEVRGGLTRLVESLLMDAELSYLDIINAVLKDFPKANTSARSIASVAAGMRRKGIEVPMRRPAKKEEPANAEKKAVDTAEA